MAVSGGERLVPAETGALRQLIEHDGIVEFSKGAADG